MTITREIIINHRWNMQDFENILDDDKKREGFSIFKDGCGVNLSFLGVPIARFKTDGLDEETIHDNIDKFFNKNEVISDYCYEFCNNFYDNSRKAIESSLCFICGQKCKRLCKYAKVSINNLERVGWMSFVLKN